MATYATLPACRTTFPEKPMTGAIRVRNRRGELVDAPQYTASEAKHKFGQMLDTALRTGPVAITRQRKPTAVLISLDEYRALTQAEDRTLAVLAAEFDRRYDAMQAPGAAAAMQRAFDTPAAQLGVFAAASLQPRAPAAKKVAPKRAPAKRG
jgi:prevent-host-death family protein